MRQRKSKGDVRARLIVRKRCLHLLSTEDKALLCWWDAFFFLDTLFDALNLVGLFDIQLDLCIVEPCSGSVFVQIQHEWSVGEVRGLGERA